MPVNWPLVKLLFNMVRQIIPDVAKILKTLKQQHNQTLDMEQQLAQQLEMIESLTQTLKQQHNQTLDMERKLAQQLAQQLEMIESLTQTLKQQHNQTLDMARKALIAACLAGVLALIALGTVFWWTYWPQL